VLKIYNLLHIKKIYNLRYITL